jgi:hypothetical protein
MAYLALRAVGRRGRSHLETFAVVDLTSGYQSGGVCAPASLIVAPLEYSHLRYRPLRVRL